MAKIQTQVRLIKVKETFEQVKEKMDYKWLELTEDTSFLNPHHAISVYFDSKEQRNKDEETERKIRLNRDYIIELYE